MTEFRCIPIPTATAERFRGTGMDENGNRLRRLEATAAGGFPCRHCLLLAEPGETVLLGSYNLPGPKGIYWTPSPIFVHERVCDRFDAEGVVAEIVRRNALVSVRAYDAAEQCIYELGEVCDGAAVLPPLLRALADQRTSFVNVHTARPGCLLTRVERVG
jgi:hypothetical protein